MQITVNKKKISAKNGECLGDVLIRGGVFIPMPCGGKGKCGKCLCRVISGSFSGEAAEDGFVHACRVFVSGDAEIEAAAIPDNSAAESTEKCDCVAVDIGTTVIEAGAVKDGIIIRSASTPNPQRVFGADVLSRISAAEKYGVEALREPLVSTVCALADTLCRGAEITVTGNTVMLYIFRGINPSPLGVFPFSAPKNGVVRDGRFTVLPHSSAFIGADTVCGVCETGMDRTDKTEILCDLGTNCEMAIAHKGKLFAASAAAGPALEGYATECGMSTSDGAITAFSDNGRALVPTVVGKSEPAGLAATGIIDLIACLLRRGVISESGNFTRGRMPEGYTLSDGKLFITDKVYLSENDISAFLSAKSAVFCGISSLIKISGALPHEVSRLYLAGALGKKLNIRSAAVCEFFPEELAGASVSAGNTALSGAAMLTGNIARSEKCANSIEAFELSQDSEFCTSFVKNLKFTEM